MPLRDWPEITTVLLVADISGRQARDVPVEERRDLEKSSIQTVSSIMDGISQLGVTAIHIQSLEELSQRAALHEPGDLVLSIFGGERSRNRMALVPAICESFGLRFVGPDVYGRIICQDKEISKRLALQCGVRTPRYHVVRSRSDLERIAAKEFPLVVKPNFEGSSIGISARSLVRDIAELKDVAIEVLTKFEQPVLMEEFIPGREVSYNMIESGQTTFSRLAEIRINRDPHFFDRNLFCADLKNAWTNVQVVSIDDEIAPEDGEGLQRLAAAVGHLGYCRVDGKLLHGSFHFLELTPDAWLDPSGAFSLSFTNTGWTYSDVLEKILTSARVNRPHQSPNG
jgi:D-alanine-D-alanine ligase